MRSSASNFLLSPMGLEAWVVSIIRPRLVGAYIIYSKNAWVIIENKMVRFMAQLKVYNNHHSLQGSIEIKENNE